MTPSPTGFEDLFRQHNGRQVDKWRHYFPIYDRHFGPFRESARRILEIGVDHGGSLQIWKQFFPNAQIVGIDINPACAGYAEDRIKVCIGSQDDPVFLGNLGEFDIVIDDGSHIIAHQEASIVALWPRTKNVYLIEDIHGRRPGVPARGTLTEYPWVMVMEKPQRLITGTPSRELRPDEQEARAQCAI